MNNIWHVENEIADQKRYLMVAFMAIAFCLRPIP